MHREDPMRQGMGFGLRSIAALAVAIAFALTTSGFAVADAPTPESSSAAGTAGLLVYHQITALTGGTGFVGVPTISADGTRAVFADSPQSEDPATPNRIYVVNTDGTGLSQVDAYATLCFCQSRVDISADGATVVSTDSVQVRLASQGAARELVALASNEITSVRLTGDGRTVFFIVRRDTSTRVGGAPLARGVWAIRSDGSDLRRVVGPDEVAAAVGAPVEETGCCFHGDGHPLDVSRDGSAVAFSAFVHSGEYVFAVTGQGGDPRPLVGPDPYVKHVAISADGAKVAYDVIPPDTDTDQVGVVGFAGGEPRTLATRIDSGFDEPMQLSADGSRLLLSPASLLLDTRTGAARQLGVLTPGADNHTAVLTDGLSRVTMNGEATRFLYVIHAIRCADCPNLPEQLATLDLGATDLGAAPTIADPSVEPTSISLDGKVRATASATVEADGKLVSVGLVGLRNGRYDVNVGPYGAVLRDDGQHGDATANDGLFTTDQVAHDVIRTPTDPADDDAGPRQVRIQAEVETSDGLRHATAVELGPLEVVATP